MNPSRAAQGLRPPLLHKREVVCEINCFEVCEAEDEVTKGEENHSILGLIDGGIFGGSFGGLFFISMIVDRRRCLLHVWKSNYSHNGPL
jgi:hypothetical protein